MHSQTSGQSCAHYKRDITVCLSFSGYYDVCTISSAGWIFVHVWVTSPWACQQSGVVSRSDSRAWHDTRC